MPTRVGKDIILTCEAEGNPAPRYQWLQRTESHQVVVRGHERNLVISDVDYDHQGEFVCKAINEIREEERSVQSSGIRVDVSGEPRISKKTAALAPREVRVQNGEVARLEVEFCADPRPEEVWHLGGGGNSGGASSGGGGASGSDAADDKKPRLKLSTGTAHGRFSAETRRLPGREDCYLAALNIDGAHADDSDKYLLRLRNSHGEKTHTVRLVVRGKEEGDQQPAATFNFHHPPHKNVLSLPVRPRPARVVHRGGGGGGDGPAAPLHPLRPLLQGREVLLLLRTLLQEKPQADRPGKVRRGCSSLYYTR